MCLLKPKLLTLLTLMLCMGVFCVPAYAASAAPPTVVAWINGETLYIEVRGGQSGVEAAYINDIRVNYRVDNKLELPVESYAGTEQYINIYAVDFAGSKSNVVYLMNPFYSAQPVTPIPTPSAPVIYPPPATQAPDILAPTPSPTSSPTPPTAPPPTPTANPEPTTQPFEPAITPEPQSTESAVPDGENLTSGSRPFTPDGAGGVMDNATEADGKEFFTITTEDGNVFYLVVDRQRNENNVYLLNAVTEQDLLMLAEKDGTATNNGSISAVPTPEQPDAAETQTPPPAETPEPETEPPAANNNNNMYIIMAITIIGVGGAGYYFKIVRGRKNADDTGNDEYEDEYGYDDETESAGDTDESEPDSEEE